MGGREGRSRLLGRGGQEGPRSLSWSVRYTGRAKRELKRLDPQNLERVIEAIHRLAEEDVGDVIRLTNVEPPQWRLRVGPWRVLFAYQPQEEVILIMRVLPRGKAYDR